ncbi:methyltransferase domain-containing protein [Methylomonas sp. EFPC3]|uniref:methyltransferase domain-containing protein n=1 Tax=Methylomonas sp. EFPC3 TaxID=3021710 RepID=UPI00241757A3|nr:methyltransferase domain-containing protein [Methylomonas sp. EFPC3]WFP51676.1 methyltransferase domain-containing protein [Methylomonas sp. EFPC3]
MPYNIIRKAKAVLLKKGFFELVKSTYFYLINISPYQAKCFSKTQHLFKGKIGMEIGGPSSVFMKRNVFPVYSIPYRIDNCNFNNDTTWEGKIENGQTFYFNPKKKPGWQFFFEATNLTKIASNSYAFLLSSHMLEHSANPILALSEWIRILKQDGLLVILLPHKDGTFDHRRPVTTMEHLISDFINNTGEDDLTHMPEILALHDLELDKQAGDMDCFKARSERNFENRCFHHHVFDTRLAVKLIDYMQLKIRAVEAIEPLHILVVAQKTNQEEIIDNSAFTSDSAHYFKNSPFKTDHQLNEKYDNNGYI